MTNEEALDFARVVEAAIIKDIPEPFWATIHRRCSSGYHDTYKEIEASATTLDPHRLPRLKQDRMFRTEWDLSEACKECGVHFSATEIVQNGWHYGAATSGAFVLTQSYVPNWSEMPQPARFREDLAERQKQPTLGLMGNELDFSGFRFYGLLIHNPLGKNFTEDQQKLASMQLCIPDPKMEEWVYHKSVLELASLYQTSGQQDTVEPGRNIREPKRKPAAMQERDQNSREA